MSAANRSLHDSDRAGLHIVRDATDRLPQDVYCRLHPVEGRDVDFDFGGRMKICVAVSKRVP